MKTLSDKVDDMLLENHEENEDTTSLSHHLGTELEIKYNLQSLMKSEQVYDVDPELIDPEVSDIVFLANQRRRAETKLIKNTIIYKLDQGHKLSANETQYLNQWTNLMQKSSDYNLSNHRDAMLPDSYNKSSINELSGEDFFALNQIPNVQITRKDHGGFALNDIVLELSHFLDEEVINRVELQLMSDRLKKDWDLPQAFQIMETRNKEIGLTLNELEEVAWRMSGQYEERDIDTLTKMFSINRNKDYFDQ